MFVSAILAAGGRGTRMGAAVPKQLLMLGNRSILQRSFDTLEAHDDIEEIIVALPSELAAAPPAFLTSSRKRVQIVDGGERRQDSVANAFSQLDAEKVDRVVIHDAARPLATPDLFHRIIESSRHYDAVIPALRVTDTLKEVVEREDRTILQLAVARTISRDSIYSVQTPQVFNFDRLAEAIERGRRSGDATDEATLMERAGHTVAVDAGEITNIKITTEEDLRMAEALVRSLEQGARTSDLGPGTPRIGVGYDLHRLEPGRKLIIGGVEIPHDKGLAGHSDADVLCHAITDAILGGAAQGDIGRHFPDTDPRWKDANSIDLLGRAAGIVRAAGFTISNIDAVVIAEAPKLFPHLDRMRATLAAAMGIEIGAISVKGKTNEKVGELGRGEAIAVHAVAMLAMSPKP